MCVVVPTSNNAHNHRFVYNIQSILNQNYTNYLIVVVDDHSHDSTGILIEKYLRRNGISKQKAIVVRK
jgi:glycosyltransferase involved in cell wall biosynthesis